MADAKSAFRWQDLRMRAISAAILAPAVLLCIWFGGIAWMVLIALAVAGMVHEWMRICRFRFSALAVVMLLAIGLAGAALLWLRQGEAGRANVIFTVLIVWASDIGAYMCGRLFGGPKLAPSISPSKTWSGAMGGLVSVAVVGMLVGPLLAPGLWWKAALIALPLGMATQIGDLIESAFKRQFDVKDSGTLIPGHGGLLDRLDGLLIAAPVAALMTLIFGAGVLWQ